MTIVYTCDNNFVWIMGVSMVSLFENNRDMEHLDVYLLGDNVSAENVEILKSLAKPYEREVMVINVPDLKIPESLVKGRWPKSAFTRMYSGVLMPKEIRRILYLDCDTIVSGSIKALDDFDMGEYAIASVKDCVSSLYKKKIGIDKNDDYINAGVLLMDLDKMRDLGVSELMDKFIRAYKPLINYADQDVLNGMFKGKFGILPPEYDVMTQMCVYTYPQILQYRRPSNYYSQAEIENAQQTPIIIHYTTCMLNIRPWCANSKHPYCHLFEKYQKMTPWANKEKTKVSFSSVEHKYIRLVLALPSFISYKLIGFTHAILRPLITIVKAKLRIS
ncbi:MAG: glycosyltransferase family 8 protein [Paludibacteraceae bacterium]|nr:glycosyltransferase family 8 protein [Paludibacteraceae bacterium]